MRGVAEEAPGAYKDSAAVVDAAHHAGLVAQGRHARTGDLHQGLINAWGDPITETLASLKAFKIFE